MGQEFQVPDVFKQKAMAQAFQQELNAQNDNLSEGIGQGYGVIGYKGKQWSLRHRGQRHNFVDAQGFGVPYLDVIILQQAKQKSKSFYKKYDPNSSDGERPICASMDGVVPDLDVMTKQCDSCALCPRNVWKTDPATGRKGRECTDYKRLAVLILPTQTAGMLGEQLLEPVFLRVPPASLNSLAIMGDTMSGQGYHYSSYITRITFDPNKSWPEMIFRPLQGLTNDEAPVVLQLRNDPTAARITGGDFGGLKAVQQALGLSSSPAAAEPAPVTVQERPSTALATVQPATVPLAPAASGPAPVASQPMITGIGTVVKLPAVLPSNGASSPTGLVAQPRSGPAPAATSPTSPQATQVSDAGEPEESDAALDARIAAMIKASN